MKHLLVFTLFAFIFISLFGMNLTMQMDKNGKMGNCPFMNNSSSVCHMGVIDHIAQWKGLFEATPAIIFNFLQLLAIFSFLGFSVAKLALAPPLNAAYRNYQREHPDNSLFNNLLLAFSDGILNPRIYA